jgi:hypothetical protein
VTDTATETSPVTTTEENTEVPPVENTEAVVTEEVTSAEFDLREKQAQAILDGLLSRIGTVDDADPWLKLYIYGSPGAGKTTWTATAPDQLSYNVERGAKVLRGHKDKINGFLDVMEYTSIFQARQLVRLLKEKNPAFDKYKTFTVDSGSELQGKFNKELIDATCAVDPTWDRTKMPDGGWNQSTQFMKDFFDDLRNLDRHVIVTGHVKEEKDESTGRMIIRPNLTPAVVNAMAGVFDAVLYLERVEEPDGTVRRMLRTQPTSRPTSIMAKTRINNLDSILADSDFSTILTAYLAQ